MSIKQISVFVQNQHGALEDFTRILGEGNVDLIALSVADTTDFGILRAIVNDTDKALKLVKENGYTAKLTDVLAVAVPDSPGGLSSALAMLRKADISIEYLYSFVRRINHQAIIIFRVNKLEEAKAVLQQGGLHLCEQDEVTATTKG